MTLQFGAFRVVLASLDLLNTNSDVCLHAYLKHRYYRMTRRVCWKARQNNKIRYVNDSGLQMRKEYDLKDGRVCEEDVYPLSSSLNRFLGPSGPN